MRKSLSCLKQLTAVAPLCGSLTAEIWKHGILGALLDTTHCFIEANIDNEVV